MINIEEIKGKVTEFFPTNVQLVYIDYRDDLDDWHETFQECIEQGNSTPLVEKVNEIDFDTSYAVNEVVKDVTSDLLRFYELDEKDDLEAMLADVVLDDEIRNLCYENDNSDPLKGLLNNTSDITVRLEMTSNYDCINSHWFERGYSYVESYFGDMVDALNLNPALVKKVMVEHGIDVSGRFPNKSNRNGKEYISYESFIQELLNSCSGANLLTFVGTMNAMDFYEYNARKITFPKGNNCGLFSSWNGGGSMIEMELLRNFTVDISQSSKNGRGFRLKVDKADNYSMDSVYGPTRKFWGGQIKLDMEKICSKD